MQLKFCGLTRKADIEGRERNQTGLYRLRVRGEPPSCVGYGAARLKEHLDPEIKAVGVFVNDEPEHIAALVRDEVIDIIQLHGGESLHYIEKAAKADKRAHSLRRPRGDPPRH